MKFLSGNKEIHEVFGLDDVMQIHTRGVVEAGKFPEIEFSIMLKNKYCSYMEFGSVQLKYNSRSKIFQMSNVYVSPQYRNRGYGKQMISLAVDYAKEYKPVGVFSVVFKTSDPTAVLVCKSCGFGATYYDKHKNVWNMERGIWLDC